MHLDLSNEDIYNKQYWVDLRKEKSIKVKNQLADYVGVHHVHIFYWERKKDYLLSKEILFRYLKYINGYPDISSDNDEIIKEVVEGFKQISSYANKKIKNVTIKNFSNYRLRAGYTQAELSKLVGLRQPNLNKIEQGISKLNFKHLEKFVELLKIDHEDLELHYAKKSNLE